MNIFVLHRDCRIAAQMQCDKHVVKMTLETAQMLCTAINEMGGSAPYGSTHKNHPCNVWARESIHNFLWLYGHGKALCDEYTYRYGRVHKSQDVMDECLESRSVFSSLGRFTEPPRCMPDEYKTDSVVESYRNFYIGEKVRFAKWNKKRNAPQWWPEGGSI